MKYIIVQYEQSRSILYLIFYACVCVCVCNKSFFKKSYIYCLNIKHKMNIYLIILYQILFILNILYIYSM